MTRRALAFDFALALLLAAAGFVEAATHADDGFRGTAPPVVGGLAAAVGALPLVVRRRRPVVAFALLCALVSLPHLLISYDPVFVGGAVALVVGAESAGRYGRRPAAAWSLLLAVPALLVLAVVVPGFTGSTVVVAAMILAGWALGVLVRALLQRRDALAGELAARREAEAVLVERAVRDERTRIARDLHDVIAHCVSLMVLQAGAARLRIGIDPAGSAESIEQVERTGHEALQDLQRVLGLLRADEGADPTASVSALDDLVAQVQRAGLEVRLRVEGDPAALPPALDRSLYRVVQESLTNALKHGGAPEVDLRLVVGGAHVEVEVVNAVRPQARKPLPGGNGQTGMRERITAFGGAFTAGPDAGHYRVHAVVPVGEAV